MYDILHRVVIEATPGQLFKALTESSGLSAWWTKAEIDGKQARFYFGPAGDHQVIMKINQKQENESLQWQCIAGPWQHTQSFDFDVLEHERGCALNFANRGWPKADEFFMHCNSKWGFFLGVSLKDHLEKGRGRPHPDEPNL